jgi:hypothetical protein
MRWHRRRRPWPQVPAGPLPTTAPADVTRTKYRGWLPESILISIRLSYQRLCHVLGHPSPATPCGPAEAGHQREVDAWSACWNSAERHPDLCACMNDQVIFLASGSCALPMLDITTITVGQSDTLIASLGNV